MKKRIGLLFTIVICIFLSLNTTGCWNRRELNDLAILMGMGIDEARNSGEVELTAQIAIPSEMKSPQKGGSDDGKGYLNINSVGDTVFDAVRGFTHQSSRRIYLPHNQVIIFGRETAEGGVQKYMDFYVRDPETRLNVYVLVANGPASEALNVKSEFDKVPAMDIADLIEGQAATSQTSNVRLKDFLARLMSKTTAPIAPIIEASGEGEKTAFISGTAVFKEDRLVGELDKLETRGLLWAIGEVKSGIIVVECPDGDGKVSLEIIRASGKISVEVKEDGIHVKVEIKEEGNLGEQTCTENLALPAKLAALNKEQIKAIQDEVMGAVEKARELNADIFGFGEAVHQKYPKQWKELESVWDRIFPEIKVEVEVDARLNLTGQITRPAGLEQEQ